MKTCWKVKAYYVNVTGSLARKLKNKMSPQLQILTPITHCNMKTEMRLEEQSPNFDHIYHTHLLSAYLLISARSLLSSCLHAVSE